MCLETALSSTFNASGDFTSFENLSAFLDPSIIEQGFEKAEVATLRKRRLPLESVLWLVIGMSLFRQQSVWDIAKQLEIMLPGQRPLAVSFQSVSESQSGKLYTLILMPDSVPPEVLRQLRVRVKFSSTDAAP